MAEPAATVGTLPAPDLEGTRRRLTPRQAAVVAELVRAAEDEVSEVGYDDLTVRGVARRAGVAAATAYTYFSSKDHLLAEVLWRRMDGLPPFDPAAHPDRFEALRDAVTPVVVFAAERPAVVDAVTAALVSRNPDVRHLRDRIGAVIHRRMTAALGPAVDPAVVQLLWTAYNGALLTAGIGHAPFEDVPGFVVGAARMLLEPAAGRPARTGGR